MSRDIPIIFSGPMVRALLENRKTMTRRLAWREPRVAIQIGSAPPEPVMVPSAWQRVKAGDRLWVRENWRADDWAPADVSRTIYMADAPDDVLRETKGIIKWRPCIHLPRERSRLTLVVTATKIERLTDISEADALAEGVVKIGRRWEVPGIVATPISAANAFAALWQYINGEDSWDPALDVVALTFTVHKQNIDALQQAA